MLISNSMFEMDNEAIVIRIKTPLGDMDSSVDSASLLNFNDLMVSFKAGEIQSEIIVVLLTISLVLT